MNNEDRLRAQVEAHFQVVLKEMMKAAGWAAQDLSLYFWIDPDEPWLQGRGLPEDWWDILPQLEDVFGLDVEHWLAHVDPDGFVAEESYLPGWTDGFDSPDIPW